MKVTGWTYWGNPNYININNEALELRIDLMNSVQTPWPKYVDATRLLNDEKLSITQQMKRHNDEVDEIFANSKELKEIDAIDEEIESVVIDDIRKNGYHFSGDEHQNCDYGVPVIDDKYIYCVSMRTWGGLIAEAFPKEFEKDDKFDYTRWAWYTPDLKDKIKLPDKSLWTD